MRRIQKTEAWISLLPSTANGTEVGAQEWRYSLFLHYVINTPDLPDHYDGCGAEFSICHALGCKKGGLITARHNDICDRVSNLASKDFTPMHVRENLKNFTDRAVHGRKAKEKAKGVP